MKQTKN